jgi:hypothetical protein
MYSIQQVIVLTSKYFELLFERVDNVLAMVQLSFQVLDRHGLIDIGSEMNSLGAVIDREATVELLGRDLFEVDVFELI